MFAGGEVGIEGVKNGANGGCERFCRKRGADGDVSTSKLHVGIIDLRLGGFFQAGVAHVADDTDDGAPSSVVILSADAATDGVATGKILSGETLIDDDGVRTRSFSSAVNSRPAISGILIAEK